MTESNGKHTDPSVGAIERDIERTRAELAETVDQLTDKLDVPARTRHAAADAKDRVAARAETVRDAATDEAGRPTRPVWAGAGGIAAGVVAVVVVVLWRRRSR